MPVGVTKDPLIAVKPGTKLINYVTNEIKDVEKVPEGISALRSSTKKQRSKIILRLEDVRWLNEHLKERRNSSSSGDKIYLHELLDNSIVDLPKPEVTPRNPELEARVQRLMHQQNARDYRAMTKSVDAVRKHYPEDTISYQMKEMNKQLIAIAQFVFSVLAGFAFGFIGVQLILGNLDFGFRLLLGIICALIVALAEIYFLAKKLNEEDYFLSMESIPGKKLHQE